MVLQGADGVVLQAVGDVEDHKVAGRVVADIQREHIGEKPMEAARGTQLVRAGTAKAPLLQQRVAFGAVYEHRDFAGRPRLVASTNVLPERQFQLDCQQHPAVRDLVSARGGSAAPGASGQLVWVGVGAGQVGEAEMTRVREAVVDARAERFRLEKLSGVKPYSRHT